MSPSEILIIGAIAYFIIHGIAFTWGYIKLGEVANTIQARKKDASNESHTR